MKNSRNFSRKLLRLMFFCLSMLFVSMAFAQQASAQETGEKKAQAGRIFTEGVSLFREGGAEALKAAAPKFEEARNLYREIGDRLSEGRCLGWLGNLYFTLGDNEKALAYHEQSLAIIKTAGIKSDETVTLLNIARVYAARDEREKAIEFYTELLTIRRRDGDKAQEAETLSQIGRLYLSLKEYQKSLEHHEKALAIYRETDKKDAQAAALHEMAYAHGELGDRQKAIELYNQSLALSRLAGNEERAAVTLSNLAHGYSTLGERQKALELYNQALSLYRKLGNKSGESVALGNIGGLYFDLGERHKALEFHNLALPLQRQVGDKSGEVITLNNIGLAHRELGEYQKALEFYNQALPLSRQLGNKSGEAMTLDNIGLVYWDLRENRKALEFYDQALPLRRQAGDKLGEADTLNNLGAAHYSLGENQKALEFYDQSLPLYKRIGDKLGEGGTLHNMAAIYRLLGENRKALEFYNQALPLRRQAGDKSGEADTLNSIGALYFNLGENQKSLEYFLAALPLRKLINDKSGESNTLDWLMTYWKGINNPRFAVFYGKQAVNLLQEVRMNIQGLDKNVQKTYLQSIEHVYRRLAEILIAQGRIAEAEDVLAMLKEEEFFAYLRRDNNITGDLKAKISLSPDEKKAFEDYEKYSGDITRTAEEYESLKKNIPFGETFASLSAEEQTKYKELENKYNAAMTVFNKYLDDLKIKFANNGEQYKQVAAIESDTIGLLKSLGQPRTVIISTIVGEDRLNLIVTTSDIQKAHTVEIKAADLNKLVADFREAVKNSNVDPRPLGKQLYDKLFPAALQKDLENIKTDTIIWSLDGTLRYVPMSALWDGQKYLVERYNNAVITLASRDKLNAEKTDRAKWQAFGVGVSKKFESFNELPAVPKELCSVVRDGRKVDFCKAYGETGVFGGVMLPDEEFTFDVFQQNLGKTAIVHIASHFALNSGEYNDSYLLLGGGANRRFSLDSLKKTRLDKIELLTLSACNTAMSSGATSSGVEIEGFGALAQNQGAKSVLATLWAVADDSTGRLMTEFYNNLENDKQIGKAEALRKAQIIMIRGEYKTIEEMNINRSELAASDGEKSNQPAFKKDDKTPFAHPYYWSPFVLIGNWR